MNDKTETAPLHDSLRDLIGQAISDEIAAGAEQPDWCDSREIDRLADAVLAVLPATQASAPVVATAEPFMYAIMGPDGKAYFEEHCVDPNAHGLYRVVNALNDSPDTGYSVVSVYLAAPQQHAQAADEKRQDEAHKLARILFGMVEGDGRVEGVNIYAEGYSAPDGDVFVLRAAELLIEQAAESKELTRHLEYFALQANASKNAKAAVTDEQIGSAILSAVGHLDRLEYIEAVAVARAVESAILATRQPTPADPMDWPLPCDVQVGAGTHKKGVPLRSLVARMKVLHGIALGAPVAAAVAQGDVVPEEWFSEPCGALVDHLSYGYGFKRGFNHCREEVLARIDRQPPADAAPVDAKPADADALRAAPGCKG